MGAGHPVFDAWQWSAAMVDVAAASRASPSALALRQQQRFEQLVQGARDSAFYADRLPGTNAGRPVRLTDLEPVARAELMARFDDWVTDPQLRQEGLLSFLKTAAHSGKSWRGRYMVWESSGTSGKVGIFVQDARAMAVYDALQAVRNQPPLRGPGLPFSSLVPNQGERHALVVATGGHFASLVNFERLRSLNPWMSATSRSFSLMQPIDQLVDELNHFRPTVLATYPTAAMALATEALSGRLNVAVHCVMLGGEDVSDAARQYLLDAFGGHVQSSYGTSEFLPIAFECAHGNLHVNADWVILEPVDANHQPTPPGEFSHHTLLTNLANQVQPLIRYYLDDRIRMSGECCACGSPLPLVEVRGRSDDVFKVPAAAGGNKTVSLLPLALCTVLEEECGVFDFQLCQQAPSELLLRLPHDGKNGQDALECCRRALQDFAHRHGAAPVRVVGETGCATPRGRSGKAFRVVFDT